MSPKKKFDFFNGGRGVDMRGMEVLQDVEPVAAGEEEMGEAAPPDTEMPLDYYYGDGVLCSSGPGSASPCSPQPTHPYLDYPSHSPPYLPSDSPPTYCDPSPPPVGYHSPQNGLMPPTSPSDMVVPPPGLPHHDAVAWAQQTPYYGDDDQKKEKRKQRCRLCANHGIYVEVKGHKWYCHFRDPHKCDKCEITRKRQYYMAEQQKLTREQQMLRGGGNGLPTSPPGLVVAAPVEAAMLLPSHNGARPRRDFPRLDELVRETSNILNEELFEMINKVVRPKGRDNPTF